MKIRNMRVNHMKKPMGYACEYPVFSWITESGRGRFQTGARMKIALDEKLEKVIYDSGWQKEIESTGFCPNVQISPRTRYYWQVQVRTDKRETIVSPVSWFETGKMQEVWLGEWIAADFNLKNKEIHPLFQKKFYVPENVEQVRVYACGLGVFELVVNGEKVSEEYLAPFYTDYHNWIQYVTYDITHMLKKGEKNAIGASLGNGWYKGRFSYEKDMRELYGNQFQFIAEIRMETAEGREILEATDETWECAASPVKESGIYDGEVYDARDMTEGFGTVSVTLPGHAVIVPAPKAPLKDRLSPVVSVQDRRKPIEKIITPAGETVLDFGQIITGWIEFECREPEGTKVRLQYGEILQDGNFYRENLRSAKAEMIYISDGKQRHVRPHFTFFGFRYVKITGMEKVNPCDFTACVIHSAIRRTGCVQTSNPKVNRLFRNTLWGQKGNFLDVPTDCPQRDERLGWTGDAQAFCAAASFHMETPGFYRKYLYDMKLDQQYYGGGIPHVVPDVLGQVQWIKNQGEDLSTPEGEWTTYGSCAWGDAACIIPWTLFRFYGDTILLAEQYPVMRDWVDYIRSIDETKCENRHLWSTGFHFADWLALDNPDKTSCFGGTDNTYVATAFYYYSVKLTAKAALVLGLEAEAKEYKELAGKIKKAFRKQYFTESGNLTLHTQTALVLALYFRLAPAQYRKKLQEELKRNLKENGMHLTTGFVGTCYLCPVLSECGLDKEAYDLLLQEEYPGWLYEVNMGATTVWERWNSVLPDGKISDTGMNSLNHYAYGVIAEWMYRYMCGLNPLETGAGFKRAVIAPKPDRRLEYAECTYDSVSGTYRSGWEWTENGINFQVTVPFDAMAKFILPFKGEIVKINGKRAGKAEKEGRVILPAGTYEISVQGCRE